MATLIAENNYLIPESRKANYSQPKLHLLVLANLEKIEDDFPDPV
jgi:hypothetical protein